MNNYYVYSINNDLNILFFMVFLINNINCISTNVVEDQILYSREIYDNVIFEIASSPFVLGQHSVVYCNDNLVCIIDGNIMFGSDGVLPASKVDFAKLIINGVEINLDTSGMFNAWVNEFDSKRMVYDIYSDYIVITVFMSDGAGTYVVQWLVRSGGSIRTIISDDYEIIEVLLNRYDVYKDINE